MTSSWPTVASRPPCECPHMGPYYCNIWERSPHWTIKHTIGSCTRLSNGPTEASNHFHRSPHMGPFHAQSYLAINHTIGCHTRLLNGPTVSSRPLFASPLAHCLAWAHCMQWRILEMSLHWPINHTIGYRPRLTCGPTKFIHSSQGGCTTFRGPISCIVGWLQLVHWPIMDCRTRLSNGPEEASRPSGAPSRMGPFYALEYMRNVFAFSHYRMILPHWLAYFSVCCRAAERYVRIGP